MFLFIIWYFDFRIIFIHFQELHLRELVQPFIRVWGLFFGVLVVVVVVGEGGVLLPSSVPRPF